MKITYEEYLKDREEMPVFDEWIFYPEIARRKLGLTDEDMECIVEFFRWHIKQRNRRLDRRRIISILKLRAEQLINQKKSELTRETHPSNHPKAASSGSQLAMLLVMNNSNSCTPVLKAFWQPPLSILLTLALPLSALAQSTFYAGSAFKQQKPFLFEVEKDGKVSHILGSMHAGIPLTSYPEIAFEFAAQSKNMAFEADAEVFKKEHGEALRAAAVYPEGDSLDHHLSPKAIAKLRELFDNGQGIDHLMKYRPWAIASELGSDLLDSLKRSDSPGQWEVLQGIDNTLLRNSKQTGKPITYLDDLSRKAQEFNENTSASDLEKLLSYPDPMAHLLRCARMAQGSYLAGDESGFQRYNEVCENEKFLKRLQDRTISWIPKLDALFKTGGAFVTVGADHMNGPNGLTALLTAKGYKVRRLNSTGKPAADSSTFYSAPTSSGVRSVR